MAPGKRWRLAEPLPRGLMGRYAGLHPLLAQVLYNRGITEPVEVRGFLSPPAQLRDPFLMKGMRAGVERIRAAIEAREPIVVYGDFDADGVTATALMVQALGKMGASVSHYIPSRVDEGYGLNCDALDRIAAGGARVVVTVDCGIRSAREVAHGASLGMEMIVTDHHAVQRDDLDRDIVPRALAVINPKQQGDPYPFKDFSGVGLAFKLIQALLRADRQEGGDRGSRGDRGSPVRLEELLDLVALGTVADLAPLVEENRWLVQLGLAELRRTQRPGVRAMLGESRQLASRLTAQTIGFVLGPRLNAAGRLASAQLSYDLLMADDAGAAARLAEELGRLNRERQEQTQVLVKDARTQIETGGPLPWLPMVVGTWNLPGIVGLVAGRLAEEFYRPVIVAERGAEETRGSGRSIEEFDITAALDACRELLVRHGGHRPAAGFTVRNENLEALRARLQEIAEAQLGGLDLGPVLAIDAERALGEPDHALVELLEQLEPCGTGNPRPVFVSAGVEVLSAVSVGADAKHLKMLVRDPRERVPWDAIAFRMGELAGGLAGRVDLAYALEMNEFNGRRRPQLNVLDIRPA